MVAGYGGEGIVGRQSGAGVVEGLGLGWGCGQVRPMGEGVRRETKSETDRDIETETHRDIERLIET